MALQIRRGTDAERQTITPKIAEPIFTTDQKELYIGDGTTQGGILISGTLVNDENPRLGTDLDLNTHNITGTGNINIDGTITATGSINLGDAADDNIIVGGQIGSSLIPNAGSTFDLGAEADTWANVYADTFIGSFDGNLDGQLQGSVFADDSTLLVDGIARKFFGSIQGNIEDSNGNILYDNTTKALSVSNITLDAGAAIQGDRLFVATDDSFFFTQEAPSVQTTWVTFGQYHNEQDAHNLAFTRSRGNLFAQSDIIDDDINIDIAVAPYFSSAYQAGGAIRSTNKVTGGILTTEWGIAVRDSAGSTPTIVRVTEDGVLANKIGTNTTSSVEFTAPPKIPSYADETARDAAIPSPEAGMLILLTGHDDSSGEPKFQGYDGNIWKDLY